MRLLPLPDHVIVGVHQCIITFPGWGPLCLLFNNISYTYTQSYTLHTFIIHTSQAEGTGTMGSVFTVLTPCLELFLGHTWLDNKELTEKCCKPVSQGKRMFIYRSTIRPSRSSTLLGSWRHLVAIQNSPVSSRFLTRRLKEDIPVWG